MGLDPGKTTGWCHFQYEEDEGLELVECGQLQSSFPGFLELLDKVDPDIVVYENYRLYPWKLNDQTWSSLQTPRFIGAIEFILWNSKIPVIAQGAGQGKNFCTDKKLMDWGLFQNAQRHANDSIRHVCSYCIFGKWNGMKELPPAVIDSNPFYDGE